MDAAAEPVSHSFLYWMVLALGLPYMVLLSLSGILCCLIAVVLVLRGRGPMAVAALILTVHVPLLISVFAAVQGMISSFTAIAMSASTPKPSELAAGYSTALFAPLVGLALMAPGYGVAILGALIRALTGGNADRNRE